MTRLVRFLSLPVLVAMALVLTASDPVSADPAGPTNYRTDVTEVRPPTATIEVEMIGGDSFVELSVRPGTSVEVIGYRGEPYLRFDADGAVRRNENAPTRWLNDDRYAAVDVPASAGADATPDWRTVGNGGHYAWHDHRTHWMNPADPPGVSPGDTVLEAVIPLAVDGEPVEVHVRSIRLEAPSPVPAALGLALTAFGIVAGVRRRDRVGATATILVVWALAATVVGVTAVRSVPAETGPSILLWAPALISAVAGAAHFVVRSMAPDRGLLASILLGFGGLELSAWGVIRRDALTHALIPSRVPAGVDRAVIAGSILVGVVVVLVAADQVRRDLSGLGVTADVGSDRGRGAESSTTR